MSAKILAAVLALTSAGLIHAAGDPAPTKAGGKRPALAQALRDNSEDVLGRTVFQSLLGEFALQRGDLELGVTAWADLARRTRDPKVLARATEVAAFARQYELALELVQAWLQVEPESTKAKQSLSSLLVLTNRLDDLAPQIAKLLDEDKTNLPGNLLHLNRMLARHTDKKAVQRLVDRVAQPYASVPEAHLAMAQAAISASDEARALNETAQALQLRPEWEAAVLLQAQLLARQSPTSAIVSLDAFVQRHPDARDARLSLARLLISDKRYPESRIHFERLLKEAPDSPEVIYPAAMLALQQGDTQTGRRLLEKLLNSDFPDKSTLHFFIGQIEDEQHKTDGALAHYQQVTVGDQYIAARSRAAQLLQQQGKVAEARALLQDTKSNSPSEKAHLLLAESQLLRETGQGKEALVLLERALVDQPDNVELLYEAALLAERQGRPDLLESRLRHLLRLRPDHPHALNALGYSWAERSINLGEAEILIGKALKLTPEDPFIMDSLGWVYFRQGRLPEALATLEKAYAQRADPEIAAHLGEVLWSLNRQGEARRLLQAAAKQHPDNQVLGDIIKKLLP